MIIPIKTFEEMTKQERREHIESLIEDSVLGQNGSLESLREFLTDPAIEKIKRMHNRDYLSAREIAEKTGRHPDTIRKMFWKDTGVKKETHGGRDRKCYTTMLISKTAAKRRFPNLELN